SPRATLFPYSTLFRSRLEPEYVREQRHQRLQHRRHALRERTGRDQCQLIAKTSPEGGIAAAFSLDLPPSARIGHGRITAAGASCASAKRTRRIPCWSG